MHAHVRLDIVRMETHRNIWRCADCGATLVSPRDWFPHDFNPFEQKPLLGLDLDRQQRTRTARKQIR